MARKAKAGNVPLVTAVPKSNESNCFTLFLLSRPPARLCSFRSAFWRLNNVRKEEGRKEASKEATQRSVLEAEDRASDREKRMRSTVRVGDTARHQSLSHALSPSGT